jgi:hypothetical protein
MKNKDPHLLSNLPAYGEDGSVHAVVESPKGSPLKLKFEIKLGTFTVAHSLPLGLSYPFIREALRRLFDSSENLAL